jgi:N-ethylmaleimide reductase
MAPLTRGRAGTSRVANAHMAEYYSQRASAGLIISEATAISEEGYGWFGSPGIYTKEHAEGWKLSTDAVHAKGGVIFAQLWHMGRQAHSSFNSRGRTVSASAIKIPGGGKIRDVNQKDSLYEVPHALTVEEIKATINDYRNSALVAKEAGFDGVELHGANGYLIDQFLQSVSNQRTDAYGGSIENRIRFLLEVVESVTQVFSPDRVGVRLGPNGVYGGMGGEDNHELFIEVAKKLNSYGLAYLHVMDGLGFGFHNKCAPVTLYDMKKHFNGPIIGNVGFTKETAEGAIRSGACDFVAFGRPYISNPDLVERFKNNWPLEPTAPMNVWYGRDSDPENCLEGYTTYKPYEKN